MTQSNHTTSIHSSYSLKDFPYQIQSLITRFIILDKAQTAKRLQANGFKSKEIAKYLFGSDHPSNVRKVFRYLREVA